MTVDGIVGSVVETLKKDTNKIMDAVKKEIVDMGHVNIIVSGKTGVGKSTLINSVFHEKLADTGIGAPVTKEIRLYEKEGFTLRVYDTVGLELGKDNQKQVATGINTIIKNALAAGDSDKHIHCIWYCVNANSHRFEPVEEEFIEQLAQDNAGVPVIIVLTLAHSKAVSKELRDYIETRNLHVKGVFAVLAEDYHDEDFVRKAYGGEELVTFTYDILPDSVKLAFARAQAASLKLKRDRAYKIIAATTAACFGIGFAPIPFADAAALVPAQIGMIASITAVYGLNIDKAMMTAIISSVLGTSGATIAGKTIVANLLKFIPGVGTAVGGMISGTTAAALTSALGKTYVTVMEKLAKGEINESDLQSKKFMLSMRKIFKQEAKIEVKQE
ncbi:MAG: 50S ribosome-binding GTPase [Defluviitaleaceae bacterium]|nr:50S ribosome-binding GTPase [Defluviitaleaceae bacterium]